MRALRIGLTGGIASGKSTIARMFADLGVPVIDTDKIARAVVRPGGTALAEIIAEFGEGFLDAAGSLDRGRLREHVFTDPARRRRLEEILHPRIEAAALAESARAEGPYQVLVVPLLIESGFDRHVDRILVVDCPEALQRQRLLQRDGGTAEDAGRVLAAQLSRDERLRRADDVIVNDGDLDAARACVRELHGRYLEFARNRARD